MAKSDSNEIIGKQQSKARKNQSFINVILTAAFIFSFYLTAYASNTDPIAVVNNLSEFIFGLIRAVGLILLGFGVVQLGLSLKSHDPSQRANGLLTLAGGIVIAFAKEIMEIIIK
ncbi:MAG: glutamyl-tRNA amidotransferase [Syntrophomonadaceae bacterium]|jgi:capsular polysaccharide biosynthesis protein|nr:glutamyl-tRNA amidotransferase [Syntrophomonadaceae bacterium]